MASLKQTNRTIWSWALYDWANSAYATTVLAAFFPIFFKEYCCKDMGPVDSTYRLTLANSLGSIIVLCLAPILGAMADQGNLKKTFLAVFVLLGIICTAGLYLIEQNMVLAPMVLLVGGIVGFSGSLVFYDAMLKDIATPAKYDMVSALGYSMGYLGGGLLFAVNVLMVTAPNKFGLPDAITATKVSFLTVALWWFLFTLPLLLYVKEKKNTKIRSRFSMIASLKELLNTFRDIRRHKPIFLFLLAYWCYIDGVDTIFRLAVDYGKNIQLPSEDLIKALLITQFVGFPAALLYGYLGKRFGARRLILFGIIVYLGVTVFGALMATRAHFYILAIVVGLVQGGLQAMSRSYYARLIPEDKTAEYFGFYNMLGKFASVFGPLIMGFTAVILKKCGASDNISVRCSIVSIAILFLIGGGLLLKVKEPLSPQD